MGITSRARISLTALAPLALCGNLGAQELANIANVPATPLVTHDPYFSVWSFSDRLTDDWPRHWTGTVRGMCGLARVDGATFRWMGNTETPPMEQIKAEVLPTRSCYSFSGGGVRLDVEFLSPLIPDDLDLFSRPVSYVHWTAASTDGAPHEVAVYLDMSGESCTNVPSQEVVWGRHRVAGHEVARMGTSEQPVLEKRGDDLRQDWGWVYLTSVEGADVCTAGHKASREHFAAHGGVTSSDDLRMPRAANDDWPVLACAFGARHTGPDAAGTFVLAYDDEFSIEYFHRKLRPYWRRDGREAADLLRAAIGEYAEIREKAVRWDAKVLDGARARGGPEFAALCALAFRQTCAAHKLVGDWDGTALLFSKENFSNGCIATVDVTYPSAPFFLWASPELTRALLRPALDYGASARWKFPFAPHDLGTYPRANGQVYGGGETGEENQMPVEETGNLLLLVAALARVEGNSEFARPYLKTLDGWADYLLMQGLDPPNQLCTDDFAGHLAHNANLSLKAILAVGAYAQMLSTLPGQEARAAELRGRAEEMSKRWVELASEGDHFKLAFDRSESWSQKYNLAWDGALGLGLFEPRIAAAEAAYYRARIGKFGLSLDNRASYTKLDWEVWTASMTGQREDFDAIMAPVFNWVREGPARVPLTDWYDTADGRQMAFQARSVVGGVYFPLMAQRLKGTPD